MRIEIWSDVVCPWCYIGKRRLERALGQFEHAADVEVTWRSFQLNPDTPPGTAVPTLGAELAKAEGLDFDFGAALTVNTLDAHRLLHLAADAGVGDAAKERLLRAHFTEGADLSDQDTLTRLLTEAGADEPRVRAVLASDEYADAVRADFDEARMLGANGVPFFVIDRTYGVSGAQSAETFLHALRTAYAAEDTAEDAGAR